MTEERTLERRGLATGFRLAGEVANGGGGQRARIRTTIG